MFGESGASAASPAVAEPVSPPASAEAPSSSSRLAALSSDQRLEWRKTGKLPDAAPAASAPATEVVEPPAVTTATSEPVSEPADDDPEYKPKTAARIKKLLADNAKLASDLAAARQPAHPAATAASATAPAAASTLVKPDPEKFTYGTADPAYLEALTDYKVAKSREEERAETAEAARKHASTEAVKRIQESWKTRVAAAKVKHADFEAVALATDTKIPQGSLIDSWILESEHGAEVLYDLQKNPAEVDRLLTLSPLAQTRELVLLEGRLAANQPRIVTSAPAPGETLTARAGDPTKDPVKKAIKDGNARAYIDEMNERELASKRPRRK